MDRPDANQPSDSAGQPRCGTAADPVLPAMVRWLEQAVIGLNLCPFARAVHVKGLVRWVVLNGVSDPETVREAAIEEMRRLQDTPASETDTTLIVLPDALHDFDDFNRFVESLSSGLKRLGLRGVLQIASFHPQFLFAGEAPESRSHFTNRAPYPTLHLLREDSIARAVERHPDPDAIWQANMDRLEGMDPAEFEQVFPCRNSTAKS